MKKLKDALLRLISQKPNPITIPPPSDPSTDRAVGTTMALLDEVILIYPNGQTPTQIDPHRQLMRVWHYDMPNGYWGAWDTQFYFTADFHWGDQPAVRLPRVRADDDPALHRPWNKKPIVDSLATVRAALNAMSTHTVGPWPPEIVVQVLNAAPAIAELCTEVARLTTQLESANKHRELAQEDDRHSLSNWLRLLKAVDPKAENTEDALRVLAERTTAMVTADREVARLTARVAELEALAPSHPVYLPLPAQDRAEELIRSILIKRKSMMSGLGASLDDKLSDTWASEWINATRSSLTSLGAPATTPTAAPGLVAWVSEEELACAWFNACEPGGTVPADIDDFDRARVRAVLARLNATTIAPVDPEAVARAYHDSDDGPPCIPTWIATSSHGRAIAAMRATLTAHGIPVTPEVGK